ncbi:MAG: chromosome partitioning protein [Planctomycetota bacterium]
MHAVHLLPGDQQRMKPDLDLSDSAGTHRVLAFMNQKGGCGKTTTAVHLAGALSSLGERVLLIDLDPQAHATMALGYAVFDEMSLIDLLLGACDADACVQEVAGNIRLIPSSPRVAHFEESAERMLTPERRLLDAINSLSMDFDWILLDCPPRAGGVLCANAMRACDEVVLVVETGAFALQGALQALQLIEAHSTSYSAAFDVTVLATMFDRRTRFAREVLLALQMRFGDALLDTVIRSSIRLREAAAIGEPIQVFSPRSRAAKDFAALASELMSALGARSSRVATPDRGSRVTRSNPH